MDDKDYMNAAFDEAHKGIEQNEGGPFGAIIVADGHIIGRGHNRVIALNDPSAHAEIVAIRQACGHTKNFHLPNAVLYTTCEPCPMCLSAIYWAKIPTVFYSSTRFDAERIGFSDKLIYDEISKPVQLGTVSMTQLVLPKADILFSKWLDIATKTLY